MNTNENNTAYEIIGEMARDVFGQILRARQTDSQTELTLHVLDSALTKERGVIGMLQDATQTVKGLDHPNIASVLSFDPDFSHGAVVMRGMPGGSLAQAVAAGTTKDSTRAEAIIMQLAAGMAYLHRNQIVLHTLSPSAVFFDENNVARISPVVTGKLLTMASADDMQPMRAAVARSAYCAPELRLGGKGSFASDIYSLGLLFYDVLRGSTLELQPVQTLGVGEGWLQSIEPRWHPVLRKSVALTPQDRFQSMDELFEAIRTAAGQRQVQGFKPTSMFGAEGGARPFFRPLGVGKAPGQVVRTPGGVEQPVIPVAVSGDKPRQAEPTIGQGDVPGQVVPSSTAELSKSGSASDVPKPMNESYMKTPDANLYHVMTQDENQGYQDTAVGMLGQSNFAPQQVSRNFGGKIPLPGRDETHSSYMGIGSTYRQERYSMREAFQKRRKRTMLIIGLLVAVLILSLTLSMFFKKGEKGLESTYPSPNISEEEELPKDYKEGEGIPEPMEKESSPDSTTDNFLDVNNAGVETNQSEQGDSTENSEQQENNESSNENTNEDNQEENESTNSHEAETHQVEPQTMDNEDNLLNQLLSLGKINDLAWSEETQTLAVCSESGLMVYVKETKVDLPLDISNKQCMKVALSPSNTWIAIIQPKNKDVIIWDYISGKDPFHARALQWPLAFDWSTDNALAVVFPNLIRIYEKSLDGEWGASDKSKWFEFDFQETSDGTVLWSPYGDVIATNDGIGMKMLRIDYLSDNPWELDNISVSSNAVCTMADKGLLYTQNETGVEKINLRSWERKSEPQELKLQPLDPGITALACDKNSSRIAIGTNAGKVYVVDINDAENAFNVSDDNNKKIKGLYWIHSGEDLLVLFDDLSVTIFDVALQK